MIVRRRAWLFSAVLLLLIPYKDILKARRILFSKFSKILDYNSFVIIIMICWIISLEKNWSRCLRALSLSERKNCSEDPICCFFDQWICNLNIHGIFNKSFWGFSDRFMSGLLRFHDYQSFFYELGEKNLQVYV